MVHVFVDEPDGERNVLDTPDDHSDMAGLEVWRTAVWGSPEVRALGARFFPVLAERDLEVEPPDVPEFLAECALLRAHLPVVALDWGEQQVGFRLANIERAADHARRIGGGVIVW